MTHRYKIHSRERCHDGFLRLDRFQVSHALYAGGMSPVLTRECLLRGVAVGVLPYDPDRDQVLLVEQFRIGAVEDARGAWILETIAGLAEAGEDPVDVARRESQEEAGVELGEMELVADYLPSPGACTERALLYCARFDSDGAGGIYGLDEEHEDIRAEVYSAEEAIGMAADRVIRSAMPVIALQWLALNRRRLREAWTDGSWQEALWEND